MKIPLFDIDWTLIRGGHSVHESAFTFAFEKVYGINDATIRSIEHDGKIDSQIIIETMVFYGVIERIAHKKLKSAIKVMTSYFDKNMKTDTSKIMPGVLDLLEKFESLNVPLGLLTGNIEKIAYSKLQDVGIRDRFTFGGFGDQAMRRSELVQIAYDRLKQTHPNIKVEIANLVIIGDSPLDIECAKSNHIDSIVVASGNYSVDELKKKSPTILLPNLAKTDVLEDYLTG